MHVFIINIFFFKITLSIFCYNRIMAFVIGFFYEKKKILNLFFYFSKRDLKPHNILLTQDG